MRFGVQARRVDVSSAAVVLPCKLKNRENCVPSARKTDTAFMIASCDDFSIYNTPMPVWMQCKPIDPGWLYIIQNDDLFKVGKTTNPQRRLREARTWLPNGKLVGMKPFWHLHQFERVLLCGLATCWHKGEWHQFTDQDWSDQLTSDFAAFDDHDRNRNTVDFNYWIGGSGMGEVVMEQNYRRVSLRRWQKLACI